MVLWKFTLREIRNRPGRALLTLLSIVIGVAAVVSVLVSVSTTRQAYKEMFESLSGRAALEVVAEGDGPYAEEIVAQIEQVPGVKSAVPLVQQLTKLYASPQRHLGIVVMGIDPAKADAVRDYEIQQGTFFKDGAGALMEVGLAESLGFQLGQDIKLPRFGGIAHFTLVGLLSPKGAAGLSQGGLVFLALPQAQSLFRMPGQINAASIVLEESADENQVRDAIAALLPPGLSVRAPAARNQLGKETMQKAEQGLSFIYIMMLGLAIIMILNTFLMNVGERRRQISILRAIGTTRGQIARILLLEGLAMGVVGTLLGSVAGLGGAYLLTGAMSQSFAAAIPAIRISILPFLVAAIVGPGISVAAMGIPAWIGSKVSPLEGMRPDVTKPSAPVPISYALAGVAIFAITGSCLFGCIKGYIPVALAPLAGAIFTVAFVCLIPATLGPLTRLVEIVFRPLLGAEGQIAARQIVRRRARATLTIGVLYVAASSGVAIGTNIINNVNDVRTWHGRMLRGDFFVRGVAQDAATGPAAQMPESLADDMAAIEGVERVERVRYMQTEVHDRLALLLIREYNDPDYLPVYLVDGDAATTRRGLFEGQVVVGTVLAQKLGKSVGDEITLPTRQGPKQFQIAATSTEYLAGGSVVHMERSAAKRLLGIEDVSVFIVSANPRALAGVETRLKALADQQSLILQSFADLRRRLDALLNGVIVCLWGLLALGLVVSGFGIANTLTMNVLEQTRELAMLRVVAMTRQQVRKTIIAQALVLGLLGLVSGTIGGVVGAYTTNITSAAMNGDYIRFSLEPMLLVGCFSFALLIVLVAAWAPAERASRLNLLIALQYE